MNKLLNMLTSLFLFVTVFLSPSILMWYFFFQFYSVVDFNVSRKAFVLNMLSYVKVHSSDEDFLLFKGLDQPLFVCPLFVWQSVFYVLFIVDISKSVFIIGFFLVWDLFLSFEVLFTRFSIFFEAILLFVWFKG